MTDKNPENEIETMETIEDMLNIWQRSASVMHIAHLKAAAMYSKHHRWFGSVVSGLGMLVTSSLFVAVLEDENKIAFIFAAFVSLITAILSGVNTSLDLGGKAQSHHSSGSKFQALRRLIEEELVRCRNGNEKDNYANIREQWTAALEASLPLPQNIHDEVKQKINSKFKE